MIFIVGARGRLGQAISSSYLNDEVILMNRSTYENWWMKDAQDQISKYFDQWVGTNSIIYVVSGVLDPKVSKDQHFRINYHLPKNIIEAVIQHGIKVVTFGTVMEKLVTGDNPYINSKKMLGGYVSDVTENQKLVMHCRIHTLYGVGQPSPFMFLGQIYKALVEQIVFEMSPGKQLREYHHVLDDVNALRVLVERQASGVIDLSHGDPENLKKLASYIFKAFDCENLLHIGALPEPKSENYETIFQRPDLLEGHAFRDSLPAVVSYLKECMQIKKGIT